MVTLTRTLVLLLGALTAFSPLTIDMYLPSLPALAETFGTPMARVQLTLSSYLFGLSVGQLVYGPMSDAYGRKAPLYVGVTLYVLASLGCAMAPSAEAMIALRFLQALGGAAGMIVSRAVVRDLVSGQEAAHVFSVLMLVMGVAPILAPLAGSYVLEASGWRAIFLVLALFGIVCLGVAHLILPETLPPAKRRPSGIVTAMRSYGQLLRERRFLVYAVSMGFAMSNLFTYITASAHLFIDTFNLSPVRYAWLFGTNAAGLIAASQINRILLRRWSFYRIFNVALLLHLLTGLLLVAAAASGFGLWSVWGALFLMLMTLGILSPNGTAAALAGELTLAGTASSLTSMGPFVLGGVTGVLLGILPDHPLSIAGAIACNAVLAVLSYRILRQPDSP